MLFQAIKTPGIAHVAYLIGHDGEALVVDPRRDVDVYLRLAREHEVTLRYVLETHRQEDLVIGAAELARAGAAIVTGRHALFGRRDHVLEDGEVLPLGGLKIRALHTPGHTPESMSYAIFHPSAPEVAWGVFTGDTLFAGTTGRTDLTDPDRTAENAGLLYDAVHRRLLPLGDQAQVFPAHGSGSVCGGGFAGYDRTTIGYERRYNPVFTHGRDEFMREKATERLPRPPYFQHMEKVNLEGGAPLAQSTAAVPSLQPQAFHERARRNRRCVVIDTRLPEAFAGGHVPCAYSVWLGGLPIFGGWVAAHDTPVLLVTDEATADEAVLHLARIGIDRVEGMLAGGFEAWRDAGLPVARVGTLTARELHEARDRFAILDVREEDEYDEGHAAGARHLYVGHLEARIAEVQRWLGKERPVAVTCSVGHRGSLAASILARHGFREVYNVMGGMKAWKALDLPLKRR